MRTLRIALVLFSFGWLAACGGGGEGGVAPPSTPIPDPFIDVDRAAGAAFSAQGISGMGLAIYDANGVKRFEKMYGTFSGDQRVAIASSSKMVDRDGGYYAILGMEVTESQAGIVAFAVNLAQNLKPLIRAAL